jgi:hypothetical protein
MAHFAQIKDGKVVKVIVVANSKIGEGNPTPTNTKAEQKGIDFCKKLLGGEWVQTSYNGNFRKQYAGIGYTYDKENDRFISPQPYKSWKLDKNGDWQAPKEKPSDMATWNEDKLEWEINDKSNS